MSTMTKSRRHASRAADRPQIHVLTDPRAARTRPTAAIRMDLVDRVRRQIAGGRYGINRKLDISLDLVLARLGH